MNDIRVDNLFSAIKSLKQERSCLEQKLQEQRQRRENLERTIDAMKRKCSQVQETNAKLQETLKVAQHKVAQTQSLSETLQSQVDKKRSKVTTLNAEIDLERQKHYEDTESFTSQLSEIAFELTNERKSNAEENVESEVGYCETSLTDNIAQVEKAEFEVTRLVELLEDLKLKKVVIDKDCKMADEHGVPLWQQKMILQIFNDKVSTITQSLDIFESKAKEMEEEYRKLNAQKVQLENQLGELNLNLV